MNANFPCVTVRTVTLLPLTLYLTLWNVVYIKGVTLPTCQMTDFHWEYTECDANQGRWRVQVPQPKKCTGGAPRPPVRGKNCDFTCAPGKYLDVQHDQLCKPCPPGTFSLGGGVRFEDWDHLPVGFTSNSETFQKGSWNSDQGNDTTINSTCAKSAWTANGKVVSSVPGSCSATLTYTVTLVKAGQLTFEYQHEDETAFFHIQVTNSKCQSLDDAGSNPTFWPANTESKKWASKVIPLKSGPNTITFTTMNLRTVIDGIQKPIRIKSIDVTGIAFIQECTKCRAGTFNAKPGSTSCEECPDNKFSEKGATVCKDCAVDEFADPGSSQCQKKPLCTSKDYFVYYTPCDSKNQTTAKYQWVHPQKCLDGTKKQGGATLPQQAKPQACPPCNPGMELKNSKCVFCPANYYSDGVTGCKACPENTAPEYGLSIQWWNNLPLNVNLSSKCLSMNDKGCVSKNGWLLAPDNIHTSMGQPDDAFLVLSIKIGGFRGPAQSMAFEAPVLGNITFVFDIKCESDCTFFFMQTEDEDDDDDIEVIKSWVGSTAKQEFSHPVRENYPAVYSWAFQKKELKGGLFHNTHLYPDDVATIYSINVTNTAFGGAVKCNACPQGTSKDSCIPCPPGSYIDPVTNRCLSCPQGTIVRSENAWGKESCMRCGEGLTVFSDQKTNFDSCVTDCKYREPGGKSYDFTKLSKVMSSEGARLFTSSGTHYFHYFNVSLCGGSYNFPKVTCSGNMSDIARGKLGSEDKVKSIICRSTIIPPKIGENNFIISAQPSSIGDILVNITSNVSESLAAQMKHEGFKLDGGDAGNDVHFFYRSDSPTPACKSGRSTVISLRCDISAKGTGQLELPPNCTDGTCDGCNFHFLWRSVYACPVCEGKIYKEVKGECVDGEQEIHLIGPKYCPEKTTQQKHKCSVLPFWAQIAIAAMCAVGALLLILILYCWKRNKSIEYKYMKLVGGGEGKDGEMELPAAETCALSDDDEEQFDAVQFKETKGNKFFSKIKNMGKKGDNPFESIGLSDKEPLT